MAVPLKNITQTLIIPPGSRERFISFRTPADAAGWFGNGVGLSGISDLRKGYLVHRPGCSHHFIGILARGKIWYRNGGDNVELSPGDLVFLRSGTIHHYESSQGLSMFWFHLDPTHSRWEYLAARDSFHRPARCLEEARGLMERGFSESQSPLHHPDGVRESLCRLILAYLDRELEQDAAESSVIMRARLEKLWREVGSRLAQDWNIPSLARLAGMSPSHFHAAVNAIYQMPPMQIVRNFRMDHAQALLLNTDYKLETIAELTGYQSAFSLSRAFKVNLGISPRHYRNDRKLPEGSSRKRK